jgi:hypothetical protein
MPTQTSSATPLPRKSHKALIVTLISIGVGIFVVIPTIVLIFAVLLAPSVRLCSGTYSQGQNVKHALADTFDIQSYGYSCLGGDAPTSKDQQVTIKATTSKTYGSRPELEQAVTDSLSTIDWKSQPLSTGTTAQTDVTLNQNAHYYQHDGYTLRLDVYSYDPGLIKVSITMDTPSVAFGIVSDKTPKNMPSIYNPNVSAYTSVPMYVSNYVPTGFEDWTIPSTTSDSIYRDTSFVSSDSYARAVDNMAVIDLRTAHVPGDYSVTNKCDIAIQDHEYSCILLGQTKSGIAIYTAVDDQIKTANRAVAVVDGYLVYLGDSSNSVGSKKSMLPISAEEVINIYSQLTYTNTPAKY